jgi:tetratricopeptide (TPR) repeat protein
MKRRAKAQKPSAGAGRGLGPRSRETALFAALAVVLAGVVAVVHAPALSAQSHALDDHMYMINNPLVRNPSWDSVGRFLGEVTKPSSVRGYYQPLTMISLMIDYSLGGRPDDMTVFRRTSLTLHVLNSVLMATVVFLCFRNAVVAALAGLLFGLHPMTVEAVAWMGERKTLLATFFSLASVVAYLLYARRPHWSSYAACAALFVLALLSKPTSTPLPVVLLLLDYWPLRRLSWRSALEKTPLLAIAGLSAVLTVVSQASAAAVQSPDEQGLARNVLIVCHNIVFYLYKVAWPADLAPFYPFPPTPLIHQPMVIVGVIGTVLLLAGLLVSLRWTRALLTGWLIFFVAITPTLGVIGFTIVIASDKYAYLPALGLVLVIAAGLTAAWACGGAPRKTWVRAATVGVVVLTAGFEAAATRQYLQVWQTTEGLYRHVLARAPDAYEPLYNLALRLNERREYAEAAELLRRAVERNPNHWRVHQGYNDLGVSLMGLGNEARSANDFKAALDHFRAAHEALEAAVRLRTNPDLATDDSRAYTNLGLVQYRVGLIRRQLNQPNEAEKSFARAEEYLRQGVTANPDNDTAYFNLAIVLAGPLERPAEALEYAQRALRLSPRNATRHYNMAVTLNRLGQREAAIGYLRQTLALNPAHADAQRMLDRLMKAENAPADDAGP